MFHKRACAPVRSFQLVSSVGWKALRSICNTHLMQTHGYTLPQVTADFRYRRSYLDDRQLCRLHGANLPKPPQYPDCRAVTIFTEELHGRVIAFELAGLDISGSSNRLSHRWTAVLVEYSQ